MSLAAKSGSLVDLINAVPFRGCGVQTSIIVPQKHDASQGSKRVASSPPSEDAVKQIW